MSELIYLASPYSSPDPKIQEERFDAVCRFAGHYMAQGRFVYSPIAHSHPIAIRCSLPTDFTYWKNLDILMLKSCQVLWVLCLNEWKKSKGVQTEIEIAQFLGIPILYFENRFDIPGSTHEPA